MGPDGHIASLFPGHSGLDVDSAGEPETVAFGVTDSPKPPAERISLSLGAVNHTRNMWLAAWGAEKAPAIAAGVAGTAISQIPAAGAREQRDTLGLTALAGSANRAGLAGVDQPPRRARSAESASSSNAAPSSSLRRSLTYARWVLYGSFFGTAGGFSRS